MSRRFEMIKPARLRGRRWTYILAGTFDQACAWARENLPDGAWSYVYEGRPIVRDAKSALECVGTWRDRKDAEVVVQQAQAAAMTIARHT